MVDAGRMLIVTATAFVTAMALLLVGRWGDDPDVGFDKVVRILPLVCATQVRDLTRKVLFCECC